ncbi:hypothetical protein OWR29_26340 [Actinoplanes sp. Pm04-4]|uniref:Uncharacterized protein n=1 Tax=Paractinoplanes pyxinae TaxID=2997416 RepID=A0ABT4B4V1_9ACTN|nr:hypothetical protein [Actinoplanes pyxinae]MCY1141532.1 hypothetical protein [Actinoplanes pyxinae]
MYLGEEACSGAAAVGGYQQSDPAPVGPTPVRLPCNSVSSTKYYCMPETRSLVDNWQIFGNAWCGTCRKYDRTVFGDACDRCHPDTLRTRGVAHQCGECLRDTRLLEDGTRCPRCHPFADYGIDRYALKPWCGRCDPGSRYESIGGRPERCRRCHRLGNKPLQWPAGDIPSGFTEQFLACDWLCFISPTLRRVGPDRLRAQLRKWFEADYTPKDVEYALDHSPSGGWHESSTLTPRDEPRVIENWVSRRLRAWLDDDEVPLPPLSAQIHAKRETALRQQETLRAEFDRRQSAAADALESPYAAQARTAARIAATLGKRAHADATRRELQHRQNTLNHENAQRDAAAAMLNTFNREPPTTDRSHSG